jgi:hypothetical protein
VLWGKAERDSGEAGRYTDCRALSQRLLPLSFPASGFAAFRGVAVGFAALPLDKSIQADSQTHPFQESIYAP